MQTKILGGACLLSVGAICAVGRVVAERRRLEVLDAWIGLISYLRAQIDRNLTPLDELLQSADKRLLARITTKGARDLPSLLAASEASLDARSLHALRQLSEGLGDGYKSDQVRLCDNCLSELGQTRKILADELPSRIRLSVTLALCIPLGAVVLLW